jgi:hypothetical protein
MYKEDIKNEQEGRVQHLPEDTWKFISPHVKKEGDRVYYRLSELGKSKLDHYWEKITQSNTEIADIRSQFDSDFDNLEADTPDQKHFMRLAKSSVERRIDYLERIQFLEETKTTNSPWNNVIESVKTHLHSNKPGEFVENFTTSWILSKKRKVAETISGLNPKQDLDYLRVATENKLAERLTDFINTNHKSLQGMGLNDIYEHSGIDESIKYFAEEEAQKSSKINEIKAGDIEKTNTWTNFVKKATNKLNEYKKDIKKTLKNPKIRQNALRLALAAISTLSIAKNKDQIADLMNKLAQTTIHVDMGSFENVKNLIDEGSTNYVNEIENNNAVISTPTPIPDSTQTNLLTPSELKKEKPVFENNTSINTRVSQNIEDHSYLEGLVNPNFKSGHISLENNFSIILPDEIARMADYPESVSFDIKTRPVYEDNIDNSIFQEFEQYEKYGNLALIVRSDINNNNFIYGHSFTNSKGRLSFDWVRVLYENNNENILGKTFTIEQEQNNSVVSSEYEIIEAIEIPYDTESRAGFRPSNGTDPVYYRLENFGLPEEARQENAINIAVCSGNRTSIGWDHRIIITAIPKLEDTIQEHPNNNSVEVVNYADFEATKAWETIQQASVNIKPTFYSIEPASYYQNEYNNSLKHNMETAGNYINLHFETSPLNLENTSFSFNEAMDYFEDDNWEAINSIGSGACKIATLLDRSVNVFTNKLGIEPEKINRDSYGREIFNYDVFTVRKIAHYKNGTIMPDDEVLISYWGPNTNANSDYEITLNNTLKNGYPVPNDLEIRFQITQDDLGNFQANIVSNYSIGYLKELIQRQSIDSVYSTSSSTN